MTPIIDPRMIYLIGLIDRASHIIDVGCIILVVALVICGSIFFVSHNEDYYDTDDGIELRNMLRRPIRVLAIALAACVFWSLLLPTKENMIAMLIAKYATSENINAVIDAIKNAAQEISSVS